MQRHILCSVLSLKLLLPGVLFPVQAQERNTSRENVDEDFWTRFEREVESFVQKATRGFLDSEDRADPAASIPAAITYHGHAVIEVGDTVRGNVIFRNGDLKVRGVVEGDIIGIGGTLHVAEGARITGSVRLMGGELVREESAEIGGAVDRSRPHALHWGPERPNLPWSYLHVRTPWMSEHLDLGNFICRYNRIEGIFLGLGSQKKYYWQGDRNFTAYGSVGYGFRSHRWRALLGTALQVPLSKDTATQLLELGIEAYSLTDSKDDWLIGTGENTAAAFFIHEDFKDYFGREGVSPHIAYYLRGEQSLFETKLAYRIDRFSSLSNNTDWALFGGSKRFRPNPAIDDGRGRSVVVSSGYSSVARRYYVPEGWTAHATAEFTDKNVFGGDFTYNRYIADIRRYQPIGRYNNLNVRLRVASSSGNLPRQSAYELGGLGTLPGYRFKEFPGDSLGANRMILLNTEYVVNGDFLGDLAFWPSWLMRHLNLVFMANAGLVRTVSPAASFVSGFEGIRLGEFRTDLGIGIANRSGSFRIGVVWRTDKADSPNFVLRFSRPF